MKKLFLISFILLLVSCDKYEEFAHNIKCGNNEIVYKTKYAYPVEIESEDWDDIFGCNLVKNTYSNGYGKLIFDDDIVAIPISAFENFSTLTHVKLPNCVKTINKSAFMGCTALKSIVIPNSVTSIGSSVFAKCTNLTDVNIPKGIKTISSYAFSGCVSLANIVIPNSVTSIGSSAFSGCASLANIVIPNSVTSIGSSAFENCSNLKNVYCKAVTPPTLGSNGLGSFIYDKKIFVPRESLQLYQSKWPYYATAIVAYDF